LLTERMYNNLRSKMMMMIHLFCSGSNLRQERYLKSQPRSCCLVCVSVVVV